MTWPPPIADDLPAPRDDEPPELRQDIADELADHLACALNRELHRTGDETRAKQNVIDRFGDPVQIGRRLWFDALKEKIMSQRIVVVAAVLLALAGFASTGLTWIIIRQTRALNEQLIAESRNAAEQSRAANQALLDKLAEFANRPPSEAAAPKSMEWNPVRVRVFAGEKGGPAAGGHEVWLFGYLLDTAKEISVKRTTRQDGTADFGLVRPGQHNLKINAPWGESSQMIQVTVLPGQDLVAEFVCPAAPTEKVDVAASVDWPNELRNTEIWAVAGLHHLGREIDGLKWSAPFDEAIAILVIRSGGELVDIRDLPRHPSDPAERVARFFDGHIGPAAQQRNRPGAFRQIGGGAFPSSQVQRIGLMLPTDAPVPRIRRPAGKYAMSYLCITKPFESASAPEPNELGKVEVIAGVRLDSVVAYNDGLIFIEDMRNTGSRRVAAPTFVAKPGEANHWKITLPQELAERAKVRLAKGD